VQCHMREEVDKMLYLEERHGERRGMRKDTIAGTTPKLQSPNIACAWLSSSGQRKSKIATTKKRNYQVDHGRGYREGSRGIDIGGMRPPTPVAPARPIPPARRSKSGLFSSNTFCLCWAGRAGGGGGRHRGLIGRSEMEVKWLISLVVGEPGTSAKPSISLGSPAPGVRADGSARLPAGG
jgi:hypothetical protein